MKKLWMAMALAILSAPAFAAPEVGVSVSVNQPGLYGRIDIGQVSAPPVLVYPQPVVIAPGPVAVQRQPIYLHVPPGHARNWRKHCHRYSACGQPVYFVREDWYQQHYHHPHPHHHKHGHHHHHKHGHRHDGDRHGR